MLQVPTKHQRRENKQAAGVSWVRIGRLTPPIDSAQEISDPFSHDFSLFYCTIGIFFKVKVSNKGRWCASLRFSICLQLLLLPSMARVYSDGLAQYGVKDPVFCFCFSGSLFLGSSFCSVPSPRSTETTSD